MRELAATYLKLFQAALLGGCCLVLLAGTAASGAPVVKNMMIKDTPFSVEFDVTGQAPVKVIRLSDTEVLVAMKNVSLASGFAVKGRDNPAIEMVNVERLDGNVVAVVITSKVPYGKIGSGFNTGNTRFNVTLSGSAPSPEKVVASIPERKSEAEAAKAPGMPVLSAPTPAVPEQTPAPGAVEKEPAPPQAAIPPQVSRPPSVPEPPTFPEAPDAKAEAPAAKVGKLEKPPVYVPPKRSKSEYKGDISDIRRGEALAGCEAKPVLNALLLMKKDLYTEAFEMLDQYMLQENFSCLEQVYYLKAYAYYKSIPDKDSTRLIQAERMFQDAVVSYPKSAYLPFAYTAMGMIQYALKNLSAAEGYFNIVSQGYQDYTGMPEVQYHLAAIYDEKGYNDKALRLYEQVFQSPLENSYITDAGVGYGKALFEKRQYYDAVSIFNYVIQNDAKKVYESPDLLRFTGEANFELGLSREARENFIRVLNLFPDIPDRDVILAKVGDAYGLENNEEKAIKIYELVREKFPDTSGYISASIGIARYLDTDEQKIEVYEMVKKRFPENTYARIAMMRLAEIYQKNGEYNKCIKEIEDLLSTHPRGLRYEAVKLMQRAYEALFREQLKSDEYTKILNRYELEHTKLDRMSSRLIAFRVGLAYLRANLYEEAFNQLITAYKQYKRSERSPELLFSLGRAMDESGRDDDALKLYTAFSQRFPKDKERVTALMNAGRIYVQKNQYAKADKVLTTAHKAAVDPMERGNILMLHARAYEQKKDLHKAAEYRERAVQAFASAPGKNYAILSDAYKTLGNTYLALEAYVPAAGAFDKALSFSEGDRDKANIGFLLGDAYQKGNILEKAREAFEQVAQSYDSVWARLAQQRLSTLNLAEEMINS